MLGLAYVFGMVIPLFVMALLWDKRPERMRSLRAKPIRINLGRFTLATNTVNLLVAVGFVIMGILVIGQAGATEMTGAGKFIDSRITGASGPQSVSPVVVFFRPMTATICPALAVPISSRLFACIR